MIDKRLEIITLTIIYALSVTGLVLVCFNYWSRVIYGLELWRFAIVITTVSIYLIMVLTRIIMIDIIFVETKKEVK